MTLQSSIRVLGVVCPKAIQLKTVLTSEMLRIRAEISLQGGLALPDESKVGHLDNCWPTRRIADGRLFVDFVAW